MSLQSALATGFKNFGHAIATAAKYTAVGLKDVLKVAAKAEVIEPEVELVVGALVGPLGEKVTSLAFHALGDIANALEPLAADATTLAASDGLNVKLDLQTINDIKALVPQLKAIIAAVGGTVPAPTPAPTPAP
jgi:hypothetical protein